MSDDEQDDDDFAKPMSRSKWSTPTVQKQRLAYMDNLRRKVRSRVAEEEVDEERFNERLVISH